MGWLYCIRRDTFDEAAQCACTGICALNKANNTPGKLYHQTVTVAFMRLIWSRAVDGPSTWHEFRDAHPELLSSEDPILAHYYSKELLASDDARLDFVEPDLQELPA